MRGLLRASSWGRGVCGSEGYELGDDRHHGGGTSASARDRCPRQQQLAVTATVSMATARGLRRPSPKRVVVALATHVNVIELVQLLDQFGADGFVAEPLSHGYP